MLLGFPEGGGDAPYTGWPYTTKQSKTLLQGPGGNGSLDEVRLTPLCQQVPNAQTKTSMGCRIWMTAMRNSTHTMARCAVTKSLSGCCMADWIPCRNWVYRRAQESAGAAAWC